MEKLRKKLKVMEAGLLKTASAAYKTAQLREYLEVGVSLARRVEASRAVTGFFGSGLTDIIDNVLQIATPLVAFSGDFELSNLLGSLKVWLDKKKAQEAAEQAHRDAMMNQSYDDLTFGYGF